MSQGTIEARDNTTCNSSAMCLKLNEHIHLISNIFTDSWWEVCHWSILVWSKVMPIYILVHIYSNDLIAIQKIIPISCILLAIWNYLKEDIALWFAQHSSLQNPPTFSLILPPLQMWFPRIYHHLQIFWGSHSSSLWLVEWNQGFQHFYDMCLPCKPSSWLQGISCSKFLLENRLYCLAHSLSLHQREGPFKVLWNQYGSGTCWKRWLYMFYQFL